MAESTSSFHVVDYVVFVLSLALSLGIGVFYAFKDGGQKTTKEYLMGNRNMNILPVSVSIMVSFMSAITILGGPAEIYTRGTQYVMVSVGTTLATIAAAQLFVPLLYDLDITSSYEYLEMRFKSRAAKLTGTGISIVNAVFYAGVASYAPSTALEAVTGFPTWASILIIGGVATIYTTLGGIKAVVWTDFFQCIIMIAGVLALVIQGSITVGGMAKVWSILEREDRVEIFNWDPNPLVRHTFWGLTIGTMFTWLGTFGITQTSVQRYCSLPSKRQAMIALYLNIPFYIFLQGSCFLAGAVIFAYYTTLGCDPIASKQISNSNQLVPRFVLDVLGYPGVPGIFVASIYAGALSSVSSALSALSAVTWQDILKPSSQYLSSLPENKQALVTKLIVAGYGVISLAFAFMAMQLGGTVLQASLTFTGAATGPVLGMFLLGCLFRFTNWLGCVFGGILGLLMSMWVGAGGYTLDLASQYLPSVTENCTDSTLLQNVSIVATATVAAMTTVVTSNITTAAAAIEWTGLEQLYQLSYLWIPLLGTLTTLLTGIIISLTTGCMNGEEVDDRLIINLGEAFCCCLPCFSGRRGDKKRRDVKLKVYNAPSE